MNSGSRVVRDGEDIDMMLVELDTQIQPIFERFSGEECYGKYLDLHRLYNMYVNSQFGKDKQITYIEYLAKFDAVDDEFMFPARLKFKKEYENYIREVVEYLVSFMDRAHPLVFLDRVFMGLEDRKRVRPKEVELDIERCETVEELMGLGHEKLKEVLDCLGLKSGGTLQQRAHRVFIAKSNITAAVDDNHILKGRRIRETTAVMEAKVKKLCSEMLKETIERTRERVVNMEGMSLRERKFELENENNRDCRRDNAEEEEEEENPLKLPLGLDGKPIPYWLYKLHGLGQKFNCEICGDYTYCGRREFEMHFNEWRHQHGMQCLGIPNTKSFHEITSIGEATKLWMEMERRHFSTLWQPEVYEEFEDAEGNVYDKKTYADLTRQGLI